MMQIRNNEVQDNECITTKTNRCNNKNKQTCLYETELEVQDNSPEGKPGMSDVSPCLESQGEEMLLER